MNQLYLQFIRFGTVVHTVSVLELHNNRIQHNTFKGKLQVDDPFFINKLRADQFSLLSFLGTEFISRRFYQYERGYDNPNEMCYIGRGNLNGLFNLSNIFNICLTITNKDNEIEILFKPWEFEETWWDPPIRPPRPYEQWTIDAYKQHYNDHVAEYQRILKHNKNWPWCSC